MIELICTPDNKMIFVQKDEQKAFQEWLELGNKSAYEIAEKYGIHPCQIWRQYAEMKANERLSKNP